MIYGWSYIMRTNVPEPDIHHVERKQYLEKN